MDPLEEADAQCRAALPTPSPHRVSNDPVYDYPDSCSPRWPVQRVSLKHVRVLDRLLLTQVVWLQLTVNSATALHILQREPPGTFLVRKSNTNQRKVLCVRLSNACGPSFVHHVYIREEPSGLSLDGSALTFPDLFRLISSYCGTRDILPHVLRLPEAIDKATSHKQLEAISHLGVDELYGADDFLPLMSYVLALCDLPELLLEVEYMMELLDPALLMGEGGYYLTSLYASLAMLSGYHELKLEKTEFSVEFKKSLTHWHRRRADLPSFSDFQNFLRIGYQDPSNGCTSKTLVVRPSDTVETLCQLCAQKFKLTSQEGYGIFLYQGGKYQRLALDVRPQEIKAVLQSQEASFYFVYRRGEEEEEEEEAAGGKHRTEEEKEEEIGDPSGTQRLLRRHAVDVEDGS